MPQQTNNAAVPQEANMLGDVLFGLGRGMALSVEVFLHRSFGSNYVGAGVGAFLMMFLFSALGPAVNTRPLQVFAAIFGALWLVAVVNVYIRRWRGKENVHSMYNGRPLARRLLPRCGETTVKFIEALFVLLVAYCIYHENRLLGDYLLTAGGIVFFRTFCFAVARRQRTVELNDAVIEQREVSKIFNSMQQQ
jgi:hypothetical protein